MTNIGNQKAEHRKDIDGLRAIAVISVIIFHLGYLPNGYLGVDVFFVISGYLITRIIYNEVLNGTFSIRNFYIRRIRRIIPLVIFTSFASLTFGLFVMLPDDLENLSQSVIATNLMSNNILLLVTTGNYWDTVNDFKPLMHTWSLGVEEQFYIILPIILFLLKRRVRWILPVLILLAVFSFFLFVFPYGADAAKFYLIQYRFFEIAVGGIVGILFKNQIESLPIRLLSFFCLLLLILFFWNIPENILLILIIVFSSILMISEQSRLEVIVLENNLIQFIGKISFSLYMWHQVVFAFGRYFVFDDTTQARSIIILVTVTIILSIISFYLIETPFRDKKRFSFRSVFIIIVLSTIVTSSVSLYLYLKKGIVRDVPELDLYKSVSYSGNIHIAYNERIYKFNNDFVDDTRRKVLIVGNSFARDWANVLLESSLKDSIQISYTVSLEDGKNTRNKLLEADVIYFSDLEYSNLYVLKQKYKIDLEKVWNVGAKNFGKNNGLIYNKKRDVFYCKQTTSIDKKFIEKNDRMKIEWKDRYIDLIGLVARKDNTIPVFTDECKFISQDCTHLTQHGARYFALLLKNKIKY